MTEIFLDLSEMEAPEPLVLLTQKAEALKSDEYINAVLKHRPNPLYMILERKKLRFKEYTLATKAKPSQVGLVIWKNENEETEKQIDTLLKTLIKSAEGKTKKEERSSTSGNTEKSEENKIVNKIEKITDKKIFSKFFKKEKNK